MIYFFIIVCVFFISFHVLTKGYLNPYKLYMVFGKKGSGKTTFLTKLAVKYMRKGWKVYSNVDIPGVIIFDPTLLGKFTMPRNSLILIDEVGMIWDNRDFKSFPKHIRNYFKYQRQYGHIVYLFSQTFDVDLKLRNLTDRMYLLTNFMRVFSLCRGISKSITIQQGSEGQASTLVDQYQFDSILAAGAIQFTFIPRYAPLYQSYNPPVLPYFGGKELKLEDIQNMCIYHPLKYLIYSLCCNIKSYFANLGRRPERLE